LDTNMLTAEKMRPTLPIYE